MPPRRGRFALGATDALAFLPDRREEDVPPATRDGLVAAFREFKRAP